jgi:hypothetical protein
VIIKLAIIGGLVYFLARNIFKAGQKIGHTNANVKKKNTKSSEESIDAEYEVLDDD